MFCKSNERCWGNGVCDPILNSSSYCFDGGDCSYRYAMSGEGIDQCGDIECCNGQKPVKPPGSGQQKKNPIFWQTFIISFILYLIM